MRGGWVCQFVRGLKESLPGQGEGSELSSLRDASDFDEAGGSGRISDQNAMIVVA